jgi:hypothetical protein
VIIKSLGCSNDNMLKSVVVALAVHNVAAFVWPLRPVRRSIAVRAEERDEVITQQRAELRAKHGPDKEVILGKIDDGRTTFASEGQLLSPNIASTFSKELKAIRHEQMQEWREINRNLAALTSNVTKPENQVLELRSLDFKLLVLVFIVIGCSPIGLSLFSALSALPTLVARCRNVYSSLIGC